MRKWWKWMIPALLWAPGVYAVDAGSIWKGLSVANGVHAGVYFDTDGACNSMVVDLVSKGPASLIGGLAFHDPKVYGGNGYYKYLVGWALDVSTVLNWQVTVFKPTISVVAGKDTMAGGQWNIGMNLELVNTKLTDVLDLFASIFK